jgi:hypothetical protein
VRHPVSGAAWFIFSSRHAEASILERKLLKACMAENLPAAGTSSSSGLVSDLLGLGALGEKLLDLLAGSVQGLADPWQTRRVAKAQTDARAYETIELAKATVQARALTAKAQEELERKALARLRAREVRRQENLEATLSQAAKQLKTVDEEARAQVRDVDDDWMQAYLRYVEDVSHADVQRLWARVLSDQVLQSRPPVSLATLDSLRLMEPRLAKSLNRVLDLWMVFGKCLDQTNEAFLPGVFHVFSEEHLVLQSIGLLDIESRLDNYVAFHGFGFIFRNKEGIAENIHVTRLEPSWRGKELARVIRPALFESAERGCLNPPAGSCGDWDDEAVRAGTLAEWAESLSTLCTDLRLVGKVACSEDDAGRIGVQNVETHRWTGRWEPLPDLTPGLLSSVAYPAYVLNAALNSI